MRKKTISDWEDYIHLKWMMHVGYTDPKNYSSLIDDEGALLRKALTNYLKATNTTDPDQKSLFLKASATASGKYLEMVIVQDDLKKFRNFYEAFDKIKKKKPRRSENTATSIVGYVLSSFIWDKSRLPNNRVELLAYSKCLHSDYNIEKVKATTLSSALDHYGLNRIIQDKTGPKPR